jgi:5-dehydro-2-deoxygluconokinase
LFAGEARLDSGIYPVTPLKPYGSGDAFLGNLLVSYFDDGNWLKAISTGSAAAALVVSRRGCASAMPTQGEIEILQTEQAITPAAFWS